MQIREVSFSNTLNMLIKVLDVILPNQCIKSKFQSKDNVKFQYSTVIIKSSAWYSASHFVYTVGITALKNLSMFKVDFKWINLPLKK